MAVKSLLKAECENYLATISKALNETDVEVEIEIMAPSVSDQLETNWIKLNGLSYDLREDVLSVFCEGIDHLIRKPQEILVQEDEKGVQRIEIIGSSGYTHLIKFREPVKPV